MVIKVVKSMNTHALISLALRPGQYSKLVVHEHPCTTCRLACIAQTGLADAGLRKKSMKVCDN
eukprot:800368-Pelagomonas_calceolata.AAC.5